MFVAGTTKIYAGAGGMSITKHYVICDMIRLFAAKFLQTSGCSDKDFCSALKNLLRL